MGRIEKNDTAATSSFFFATPPPAAVLDLRGTLDTFRNRWRSIAGWAIVCGLFGILVAILIPARYVATTELYLDPRNLDVLQHEINPTVGNGEESVLISESQAALVRSTEVMRNAVRALHLERDPDFGAPTPSLLDNLKTNLLGPSDETTAETPEARAMRALGRALTVKRTDKTFVIEIEVKTSDPDRSAEVANAVATAFIGQLGRTREAETRRASQSLDARLTELRSRVRASDVDIERFRREHDLINSGGRLVTEQQLSELTSQLSNAENAVTTASARLDAVRNMGHGDEMPGDTNEAVKSAALAAIRATLAQAKRAAAESAVTYGPRYPATRELAARVEAARRQLDAEIARINRAAETDLQRATTAERQLSEKLTSLKKSTSTANDASVELHELERVANSNRSVYEAFLNRAKDLQERFYLNTVNARIVTVAVPPLSRSGIPRSVIVALSVFAGITLGMIAALLRDRPGDAEATAYMPPRRGAI